MSGIQQLLLGGSPAAAAAVDPYFYSVTSLLHGDGTNGGQNNTFLDSSTNNFTITRNGNTTQGSFSPFSQTGWSNYFDGSGDYLTSPNNAAIQLNNSTAFTLECWFNAAAFANQNIFRRIAGSAPFDGYGLATGEGGAATNTLVFWDGSAWRTVLAGLVAGQWYHFAATYEGSGTTLRFFVNGIQQGSALTCPAGISNTADTFAIGAANAGTAPFTGYVSNLRIVKGTAVYTSNFTVPTTPLTAITNTSLLTCQANRFLDASSNNFTITRNGDVSVQPFSPFNPITAYSTSAVGGSGYFDGSGDFLTAADSTAWDLSGDYTIEMWLYVTSTPSSPTFFQLGESSNYLLWYLASATKYLTLAGSASITASTAMSLNAWNHVALVRSGGGTNNTVMYLNGVNVGQTTNTTSFTGSASNGVRIGAEYPSGFYVNGYISDVRIVKGTAVYTGAFTPPTAPLTAIANTQLLTNFTNGAIFDNAADADYETVGNAQISTSVKKYGTGSMYFDGTGDALAAADSVNQEFGSGDFTIEAWIYTTNAGTRQTICAKTDSGGIDANSSFIWQIGTSGSPGSGLLNFYHSAASSFVTASTALASNTWYHVAICRIGSVFKQYINGTENGTLTSSTAIRDVAQPLYIGGALYGVGFNGYIDDFRISKGIARYPYNFTPPTAEFPNIGGTVTLTADPYFDYTTLLLPGNGTNGAQNNTFLDSSTNAFSITRNGNTTQGTFSPFSQTGWGNYFDGTGDWLSLASNSAFNLGTGEFTVECWVYLTNPAGNSGYQMIINRTNLSGGTGWGLWVQAQKFGFWMNAATTQVNDPNSITANTWTHLAAVRNSSNLVTLYVNGTSVASTTVSSFTDSTTALGIGARGEAGSWNAEYGVFGYISNARIVKGTAVYTANFTPPTTPLTAITNTSLLTCQSNRFIDNSTNNFAITANGDVSVQAFSPFNPTASWSAATYGGSGYFDGSGDYLTTASSTSLALGSGDFTVDVWFYPTTTNTYFPIDFRTGCTLYFYVTSGTTVNVAIGGNAETTFTGVVTNAWNHFACVRSGSGSNNVSYYLNGVRGAQQTDTTNFSSATTITLGKRYIAFGGNDFYFTGYLASPRLVVGTAVYSGATYTVPTAPLTAITNTSLLLNFTNAGIYDATSKNDLETVGNAQISTTQSKFGGSSMYFDGSGDYLLGPWNPPTDLGAGDFTIEFWMYPTAVGQSSLTYLFNLATSANYGPILIGQAASGYGIVLYSSSTGSSWNLASGSSFGTATANAWNHVALTRYGADVRLFLNGVVGTTLNWGTTALLTGSSYRPNIGSGGGVANTFYTGYMQDLRVTKGIARYTSNFTPPTTAFLTQ